MSFITRVKRIFINRITLGVLMLMMYFAVLFFSWYTGASAVIKKDQWHYLSMLTEYFDTGFDSHLLTLRHGEHLQLAYNTWFFLNGILFGLNTQLELFIGLLFLGGFLVILYKEFDTSLKPNSTLFQRQLMFVPILMIGLSFHQLVSFTYSLLSFGAFASELLMIVFISLLSKFLTDRNAANLLIPIMMLVFLCLGVGFAGGGWAIYFGAAIVTVCSWIITHRPPKQKILILGGGLLTMAVVTLWVNTVDAGRSLNTDSGLTYIFQHLDKVASFMLLLLANSILDINWFYKMDLVNWVYVTGAIVAGLYVMGIYLFYKTRMWEKTYAPFYLISYFWITSLALLLYRFPIFGITGAAFPRYATTLQIGLLGVLWVMIYWIRTLPRHKAGAMWVVVGLIAGVPYILNLWLAIQQAPYIRQAETNAINMVLNEQFDMRSAICPAEKLCRQGVVTLKEHRLNIYRDSQASPTNDQNLLNHN